MGGELDVEQVGPVRSVVGGTRWERDPRSCQQVEGRGEGGELVWEAVHMS